MALPWVGDLAGRIDEHQFVSEVLRDNPLDDPHVRPLWVYVPPGYDEGSEPLASIFVLQGYTGHVTMWRNRSPYRQPFPETADALIASGGAPPCIIVYVDAWTAYGGSQFVDSIGTGRYHTYLCDEIVPFVDAHYRTAAAAAHRGVMGKSSGGFGAMITPMLRPDLFGGMASHAGDALYELCYIPEFGKSVRALRDYEGSIEAWWADFQSRVAFSKQADELLLMTLGVAACFSPGSDGKPVLPFDPTSGRLRDDEWARWLAWDPLRMIADHVDTWRGMKAIWLDGGTRDEWFLELAAVAVRDELARVGVTDVRFELFDAGHGAIDYRYPLSLVYLAERLTPR